MKILPIGDLHLGINDDDENYLDYQIRCLRYVLNFAYEDGVKHVVFLGDIFHNRKDISVKALNLFKTLMEDFTQLKMIAIVGNHDTYHKNTNRLNSLQPFERYFKQIVVNEPVPFDADILMVPWINKENYEICLNEIQNAKQHICLGHFELQGFDLGNGYKATKGHISISDFKGFRKVISGHYHSMSDEGNILYTGTPYQMNWGDAGQKKFFFILDSQTAKVTRYGCPEDYFHKIIINEKKDLKINLDSYQHSMVRLIVNTIDNIDKELNKLSDLANFEIVNNSKIIENIELAVETSNMSVLDLWQEYLEKQEGFSRKELVVIDKIFNESYKKVIMEIGE